MKKIILLLLYPLKIVKKLKYELRIKYLKISGVVIGSDTYISPKAYIDLHKPGKVIIGENCFITRNVIILNHTDTKMGGPRNIWSQFGGQRIHGDVIIGDNTFIAVSSVIMPGVKIGKNVIIGALSLVTSDIPDGKIAVGAPAKVVGDTLDHVKNKK
jgi:maltose O-acetyltransferase